MNKTKPGFAEILLIIISVLFFGLMIFYVSSCTRNAMSFPLPAPVADSSKQAAAKLFTFKLKYSAIPGSMIKEAISDLNKEGYRPATLAEGWAYQAQISDSEIKKILPIACLGDVRWSFPFSFNVGIIRICGFGKSICSSHEDDIAGGTYYFLGIPK
jgi:hypothetical protein